MALLNPVYGLIVPFLFVVTVPLAILAGITTTLAFSVLMFRVGLVYIDIVVNMVPQYVAGRPVYPLFGSGSYPGAGGSNTTPNTPATRTTTTTTTTTTSKLPPSPSPTARSSSGLEQHGGGSPTTSRQHQHQHQHQHQQQVVVVARHHRRGRRTSAASFSSKAGSSTSIDENSSNNNNNNNNINSSGSSGGGGSKRSSAFMVPSSIGIDRDFEGVGGWRLNGRSANNNNNNNKDPNDEDDDGGDDDDDNDDDDDDDDDAAWTHINSRLSLPLDPLWRHHHQAPSGAGATATPGGVGVGGGGGGGGYLMMRSPSSGLTSEEGRPSEHGGGPKTAVGVSPSRSRVRTPTRMPPPLTSVDGADGSYFPRVVSPRAEKR